ncbi:hypothetical protein RPB_1821 [Rhodopseudomonas palustris HaA2]|uniref:Uncharacterized protein n=1 Tax=Rhodopseudomonas palustris (strain HaA2) TaxID=316058 RepID=Q2IZ31_RHOP2|nr:hypothetical protein [Rhodopseudomonas palustris]ABD06529.1 hypothetical protein RPB_1821 [Rhodopseudomonas palustris HaA2]
MAIAADGFQVLKRIGKNAEIFRPIRAEVDKVALSLVIKALKTKSLDVTALRDISGSLGEDFSLIVEGLKDADVKSIVTKLDKHHPDAKSGTAAWRRQHLAALADGSAEPSSPPAKPAKKAKAAKASSKTKKAEPERLSSEVMDLFRAGGKSKS